MKMNRYLNGLVALLTIYFSANTQAIIIDGAFHGSVVFGSDNADGNPPSPYFNNLWSKDIVGKTISGSFWYDTELMPTNSGSNGQIRQSHTNNWMGVTFYIEEKIFDFSLIPDNFISTTNTSENLHINDEFGWSVIRDFTQEHFSVFKYVDSVKPNSDFYQSLIGGVSFLEQIVPVLTANSVIQEFTWVDQGGVFETLDETPGVFYLGVDRRIGEKMDQGSLVGRISDMQVSIRKTSSVPEPSTLFLFVSGLFLIIFKIKRSLH